MGRFRIAHAVVWRKDAPSEARTPAGGLTCVTPRGPVSEPPGNHRTGRPPVDRRPFHIVARRNLPAGGPHYHPRHDWLVVPSWHSGQSGLGVPSENRGSNSMMRPQPARTSTPLSRLGADPTLPFSYLPTMDLSDMLSVDYDFLPEATHLLQLERPEECAAKMREFIEHVSG